MNIKFLLPILILIYIFGIWTGKKLFKTEPSPFEPEEPIAPATKPIEQRIVTPEIKRPPAPPTTFKEESPAPQIEVVPQNTPLASVSPKPKTWTSPEKGIGRISQPQDVAKFLENTKIESFMSELQSVTPINQMDEVVEFLNGSFTGAMTAQTAHPGFEIALEANLRVRNQQLRGRLNIKLSRNGRAFSRNNNNGHVQTIQKFQNGSQSLLVSSGDYHFQLYYFPGLDTFEGNCYHQSKPGTFEYVGTVHLEKL